MPYILQVNYLGGRPHYVRVCEDHWKQLYSPKTATEFSDPESAMAWGSQNTTDVKYMSTVDKDNAIKDFEEWFRGGMVCGEIPLVDHNLSRPYNGENKYEVLEWWWQYINAPEDSVLFEHYETWPELHGVFEHLWNFQSFHDVDDRSKITHSVEVRVNRDSEFAKFKEELDLVLPKLEKRRGIEELYMNIFDHKLSEGGDSAYLVKQIDGQWRVDARWGGGIGPTTLRECFNYMKRERYYE